MTQPLHIRIGQYTHSGLKSVNQDFVGARLPTGATLGHKGAVLAIADGISSSDVSQIASETAVSGFIEDYYCTPEAWSVKQSAERVLQALNAWLFAQTRNSPYRFERDRGYICTFSTLIFKARHAHLLHVGDTRIYRLANQQLEPLTEDHRHCVDADTHYLTSALGVHPHLRFDYHQLDLEPGDTFILASDGAYEFFDASDIKQVIDAQRDDLNGAARTLVEQALARGSRDNLSVQIARVEALPELTVGELSRQASLLTLPPALDAGTDFDGYRILRSLYISSRSHVYLARDTLNNGPVVIKVPAMEGRDNPHYLERFLMEDWIARRFNHTHLLKAARRDQERGFLYVALEYIDGQTLSQWLKDNPSPDLAKVRDIVQQVASGLQALHRQAMVHRDLRPDNLMIDAQGTVKIIDFGSASVAGLSEGRSRDGVIYGAALYAAPEYFLGEPGDPRSDLYSLAVLAYQMLTGKHPYGPKVARTRTRAEQHKLRYRSAQEHRPSVPDWVDECLRKATQISPHKRYTELSEFIYDLHNPNPAFVRKSRPPLIERNPVLFWQGVSLILLVVAVAQFAYFR
ncbi:bifunctional protein-serine/threonine kinase/phosphatase [Marinimicrobium sp. LS-A18]|uniref:bifunctional protein-serine/threonine kinase/phosphatase n=1 Tax=Marinimicrobium sp. LS-A18 TaxID=1381596 RepID=UPI00046708EB|nr:bifunctional protein-serine/threonine kinase/phosphatase [Marinimicrobium sp. LS-A18]